MVRTMMLATVLAVGAMTAAAAQTGTVAASPAQGDPAKALDTMLTGFEQECMAAAKAMPAEKYGFSPALLKIPGASYADVRTFVQEVTHIAHANYNYFQRAGAMKADADLTVIDKITAKDEALKVLAESFVFGHRAIATLTPANAWDIVKGMGPTATRAASAAGGVAHGFDHYGQMVEYLRMNGIVPPASAN